MRNVLIWIGVCVLDGGGACEAETILYAVCTFLRIESIHTDFIQCFLTVFSTSFLVLVFFLLLLSLFLSLQQHLFQSSFTNQASPALILFFLPLSFFLFPFLKLLFVYLHNCIYLLIFFIGILLYAEFKIFIYQGLFILCFETGIITSNPLFHIYIFLQYSKNEYFEKKNLVLSFNDIFPLFFCVCVLFVFVSKTF